VKTFLLSWFTRSITALRLGRFSFVSSTYSARSAFASRGRTPRHSLSIASPLGNRGVPAQAIIARLNADRDSLPGQRPHKRTSAAQRRVINSPTMTLPAVPRSTSNSRAVNRFSGGDRQRLGTRSRFEPNLPKREPHHLALKRELVHGFTAYRLDHVVPQLVNTR